MNTIPNDLTTLMQDLVAIETENPPGNEEHCARYIHDWFEKRGIPADLVDQPFPDRPQVAARIGEGSPTLVLNGHMDVVPSGNLERWSEHPYEPTILDDRLYGRGSVDMKSGLAIAMKTLDELASEIHDGEISGSLVFHAAAGEEMAEPGTKTLLEEGYDGDFGVVLEPTSLRTATSEKGLAWYEITVFGEPAHASQPKLGENPIPAAKWLVEELQRYDERIRRRTDPLLGSSLATVTNFHAGTKENVLPEQATLTVDRRLLPRETPTEIDGEIGEIVATFEENHAMSAEWKRVNMYEAAEIEEDSRLAQVFRNTSNTLAGVPTPPWGTKLASDVRHFVNDASIEAITWGPGNADQAHTVNEYIELDQVRLGYEILLESVRELLSSNHTP